MNFRLEPWEIPPGANANNLSVPIEFGPLEWNGEQTMISARWLELDSGEALAFFRPHEGEINYVVTDIFGHSLHRAQKRINNKILGQMTRLGISNGKFGYGRLFYCGGEPLIMRDRNYFWERAQDPYQALFPLAPPFDSTNKDSTDIFGWIEKQWTDENSELQLSWKWNRKSTREREDWLGTIVPHWNELHDLMRAVACLIELPKGANWLLTHFDTHNHAPELLESLQPWRELLKTHFSFDPLPKFYPEFLRQYFQSASAHVQVQGVENSAHEQLEAKLYLRNWLENNAPEHLHLVQ